jgi:hypothetical protein
MNLPEFYIEKDNFYSKNKDVFELIYQTPDVSIAIKHPIIFTEEVNLPLNIRVIDTDFFKTNYPHSKEHLNTVNYKQKKMAIDHTLKSLSALRSSDELQGE